METTQYNKLHIIKQEAKQIAEAERDLEILRKHLQGSLEIASHLQNEVNTGYEVLVPLLRTYLEAVQSVRMAFAREIQDILRSSQEIGALVKHREGLDQFLISFQMLVDMLERNKDIKNKLNGIFNLSDKKTGEA